MINILHQIQNLPYIPCPNPHHQHSPLNLICGDIECPNSQPICIHCQQQQHNEHDCMPLKTYLTKLCICTKTELEDGELLALADRLDRARGELLERVRGFRDGVIQQVDALVYLVENDYQNCSGVIRQICAIRKSVQAVVRMHTAAYSSTNTDHEQSSSQMSENQQNQNNVQNTQVLKQQVMRISLIKNKLKQILTFAKIQQSAKDNDGNNPQTDPQSQQKSYKITNLSQQIKSITQNYQQKSKQIQKLINRNKQQFNTNCVAKINKILQEKIKSVYFKKKVKFSWSATNKGTPFVITGNVIQRKSLGSGAVQRFALFNQQLQPYISRKKRIYWVFKITKLVGWIGLGICLKQKIISGGYKFTYENLGHGSYMVSSNGYTWSSSVKANNSAYFNFSFGTGDFLIVDFDCYNMKLNFYACKQAYLIQKSKQAQNKVRKGSRIVIQPKYLHQATQAPISVELQSLNKTISLDIEHNLDYVPCANLCSVGDAVEIVQ